MRTLLWILLLHVSLFANEPKEVLLLHSYNKGLQWTDGISEGVERVFDKNSGYEVTTEYMDTKKIDTKKYFEILYELYKEKFANRDYKAIITSDNYAFKFVLEHHETLFNKAPVIFCGVENFEKSSVPLHLQRYVTGVIEYKAIERSLRVIKSMIPKINTLYIISDNSYSSLAIKNQILSSIKPYEREFNIIYDNDIDLFDITRKINALPMNSAILYTSLYKDKYGKYIPYNQIRKLFKESIYPVFALNKIHLGEGIIGGVMINPQDQGYHAALKAIEILEGKSPLQIEITKPLAHASFDYNILNKYGLKVSDVPIGSTVINQPLDFFERNREVINSAFVMMPLLILLIIGLIINIYKRISLEVKMSEQNKLDRVLLDNIRSIIFWKSNSGVLLGCNQALCNLLELKKEDIIGKKLTDIMPELCAIFKNDTNFTEHLETTLYQTGKNPIDVLIRRREYFNKNNEKSGIVTAMSDITELKHLQQQRQKEEQFLVQRSKLSEIGEMITSIAHQWKNPLVEISSIAQELMYKQKRESLKSEDMQEFVDDIMEQVQYMTNTIDDFRSFIKPSTKKVNFDIEVAIKGLIKVIHNSLKYNYIKLDVDFDQNLHKSIYGYANEFKQSILSIMNNAKDSIVKRRQTEEIEGIICLRVFENAQMTLIEISDNGIGIPEEKLEKIFEPFFTSKKDGDGFGLYMAKVLIEDKMGGKIEAVHVKEGALIRVSLPHNEDKGHENPIT